MCLCIYIFNLCCEYLFQERDSCGTRSLGRPHKTTAKNDNHSSDYRDNYEGDCDDDDYDREAQKRKDFTSRWKSSHKSVLVKRTQQQQEFDVGSNKTSTIGSTDVPRPLSLELPYKLKSSKNTSRDRKDGNVLKRRTTDKTGNSKGQ